MGLTQQEYENMDQENLEKCKKEAAKRYREAGADIVIDSILDLPEAILEINRRLEKMEEAVK